MHAASCLDLALRRTPVKHADGWRAVVVAALFLSHHLSGLCGYGKRRRGSDTADLGRNQFCIAMGPDYTVFDYSRGETNTIWR